MVFNRVGARAARIFTIKHIKHLISMQIMLNMMQLFQYQKVKC